MLHFFFNKLKYFFYGQDRNFKHLKILLFDGESALKGATIQQQIEKEFNLKVFAQPGYKRVLAERYIREFKLRLFIALDIKKEPLTKWKNYYEKCVALINARSKISKNEVLTFFTREMDYIPQTHGRFFKYNVGDQCLVDVDRLTRKSLGFKWTRNLGRSVFYFPLFF